MHLSGARGSATAGASHVHGQRSQCLRQHHSRAATGATAQHASQAAVGDGAAAQDRPAPHGLGVRGRPDSVGQPDGGYGP